MSKIAFSELPLSREVRKSIEDLGFETATAIQGEAIPLILAGNDIIGQSRTGTGKTLAFAIPAVEKVDLTRHEVQVLILCPTRELCIQVAEEVNKLGQHRRGLHPLPIYGGTSYDRQLQGLRRGAQVVIGTPGRLIDHLKRGTLKLGKVALVVLDEADEMLDMGFQEDLEIILDEIPVERQTVLFSATMSPGIRKLASKYLKDPKTVKVSSESVAVPEIEQSYFEIRGAMKLEALTRVLDYHRVKLGIVFCNTKIGVDELVGHLQARGYVSEGLHGDIKQSMRDRIMGKFRVGQIEILVATDVAARGIDVKDIELVVNYDLPKDEEDYVHRIGRTGRAGKAGRAISFASGRDIFRLRNIERYAKVRIPRAPIPTLDQVEAVQHSTLLDKVREVLNQGKLEKYAALVDSLAIGEVTVSDVACALLKMAMPEAPVSVKAPEGDFGGFGGEFDDRGRGDKFPRKNKAPREGAFAKSHFRLEGVPGKIILNIGRQQGVQPKSILGALAGETDLPGKMFGNIDIQAQHTVVEVPADLVDQIVGICQNITIKGIKVKSKRADF